jgi:hypothetical protein
MWLNFFFLTFSQELSNEAMILLEKKKKGSLGKRRRYNKLLWKLAFIVQRLWVASRHVESATKLFF